jgi:uncharacterized protein (DUF427 family)
MLTPGPDHPISVTANPRRVRAFVAGHVIADTAEALTLNEGEAAPVQFFPRADVETGFLSESPHLDENPYLGRATYYTMLIDGELLEDAAFSYEQPYPAAEAVRGRIAFDPAKVEIYEVDEKDLSDRHHPQREDPPPFANM